MVNNTIYDEQEGINLGGTATSNMIANNTVVNNSGAGYGLGRAFVIWCCGPGTNNVITGNRFANSRWGIDLGTFGGMSGNLFYNNYIANNVNNVRDSSGRNFWNATRTPGVNIIGGLFLGGNFWSDYAGQDLNGDGIGDTQLPYTGVGGIANGGDYLPLVPLDIISPTVTIASPRHGSSYITPAIPLQVGANEPIRQWWYILNNGQNVTFAPNTTIAGVVGSNTITVYASDFASNIGFATSLFTGLDVTPPTITIVSPANGGNYNSLNVPLQVNANEPISRWWHILNNGQNVTFTPPSTITAVPGANTIVVHGSDAAGNIGSANSAFTVNPTDVIYIKNAVLPTPRYYRLACAENSATHKVYCLGGWDGASLNQIVEYAPATDQLFIKSATLPTSPYIYPCAENSATNKIYCFGAGANRDQIVEYTPATDIAVIKNARIPSPTGEMTCSENSATNKIYCFGGVAATGPPTEINRIVEYTPATDVLVTKTATIPSHPRLMTCAEDSSTHKIYCFGGGSSQLTYSNQILEYNPTTDILTRRNAVLPTARMSMGCAENKATHKIYCFGGSTSGIFDEILEYIPASDAVSVRGARLPSARTGLACAENSLTHKIYCFGGYYPNSPLNQILEYVPP